jgi:hypothetical protein
VKIDAQLKKLVGTEVFVLGPKTFFLHSSYSSAAKKLQIFW